MPPWRDPPPGRCCYVSLASKFPFSCYSKGPLRELPGALQNDAARARARGRLAPLAAVARPRLRRAAPDLRRAIDLVTAAVGVGPASRPSGAPEPRRPSAVIGTRGRGRLPAWGRTSYCNRPVHICHLRAVASVRYREAPHDPSGAFFSLYVTVFSPESRLSGL